MRPLYQNSLEKPWMVRWPRAFIWSLNECHRKRYGYSKWNQLWESWAFARGWYGSRWWSCCGILFLLATSSCMFNRCSSNGYRKSHCRQSSAWCRLIDWWPRQRSKSPSWWCNDQLQDNLVIWKQRANHQEIRRFDEASLLVNHHSSYPDRALFRSCKLRVIPSIRLYVLDWRNDCW